MRWIAVLLFGVGWFASLSSTLLTEPDEARYAEIPREMLASGDWVTPHLDGIVYFEKPPLQYWITASLYRVFGVQEWVSKLWTWISSALTVVMTAALGARVFGRTEGIRAGLILMSAPLFFIVGHLNTLDAGLTFFMTGALAAFVRSKTCGEQRRTQRSWMLIAWFSLALAVLSKGPVALVLPAIAVAAYALAMGHTAVFRELSIPAGVCILAAICMPWFIVVATRNPGFADFFFIHEHLARFLTNEHARSEPWWYFAIILLLGTLPWTRSILHGWWTSVRAPRQAEFSVPKFLSIYAAVIVVVYSLSGSKLAPYILPALPALALLGARAPRRHAASIATSAVVAAVLLSVAALVLMWKMQDRLELSESIRYAGWMVCASAIWIWGALGASSLADEGRPLAWMTSLAAALLLGQQLMLYGLTAFAPTRTARDLADVLTRNRVQGSTVYSVGTYVQGLPFYLQQPVVVAGYTGELEVPLDPETPFWIDSIEGFAVRWRREAHPLALVDADSWNAVLATGIAFTPLYSDGQSILIRKADR